MNTSPCHFRRAVAVKHHGALTILIFLVSKLALLKSWISRYFPLQSKWLALIVPLITRADLGWSAMPGCPLIPQIPDPTWGNFSLCSMDVYLELLGASTQLAICSKSLCSIAISSWPYLQDAIFSSPPLQLSRKVVRPGSSEHSLSQSTHTLHYVRTHQGTIAERNRISAKLAKLCGDSRPHWVQTEKAEIPSWTRRE
jgi:hypothetical protein